jgi:hypothetical protein
MVADKGTGDADVRWSIGNDGSEVDRWSYRSGGCWNM